MQPFLKCFGQGFVNCLFVQKITATILLLAFVATQYAKQAAYLECRITNFFNTESGKCDCEKILAKINNNPLNDLSFPVNHSHIHIDESYFPSKALTHYNLSCIKNVTLTSYRQSCLSNGFCFIADRPPQVCWIIRCHLLFLSGNFYADKAYLSIY